MGGILDLGGKAIENLPTTPTLPNDAASKAYVDSVAQGLSPKASVVAASAAALPAYTYVNGVGGVGATITKNTPGALTLDGVTGFSVGDRVLIKDEVGGNAPYNGIYTVTNPGSGLVGFVLTRATDCDQSADFPGAYVFVESGTVNTAAGFVCTNTAGVVVGTTPIVWVQFTGAGEITVVAPIVKTGNQLSHGVSGVVAGSYGDASNIPSITVDAMGHVTAASQSAVTPTTINTIGGTNPPNATFISAVSASIVTGMYYGTQFDGALTLVADTTLAQNTNVRNYSTLSLAGFTLSVNTNDNFMVIFADAISGGGGSLSTFQGTGGQGGGTGGLNALAGDGGRIRKSVFCGFRALSGNLTVTAAGENGQAAGGTAARGHAGGLLGTGVNVAWGIGTGNDGRGGGGGQAANPGGAGGGGGAGFSATSVKLYRDVQNALAFFMSSFGPMTSANDAYFYFAGACGGGGGEGLPGGFGDNDCGGGGGGGGWFAGGGAGRHGTFQTSPCGGGGGGGGSGAVCIVVTEDTSAGLTVSAKGGAGGNGSNGGGGGGGGGGGIGLLAAPAGTSATLTAAGGTKGTGGTASGGDGGAGISHLFPLH